MVQDADTLLDRRRLRRKLTFWRGLGMIALAAILIGGVSLLTGLSPTTSNLLQRPHIAEITIDGMITGRAERLELLTRLKTNDAVEAIIVKINSPGGTTAGGEALYERILDIADDKPIVATIDGLGTSAAYMAAIATEQVFARRASITGSIGVIYQSPNISDLLGRLGVSVEQVRSSPLKAAPDPFSQTAPAERQVIEDLIADTYVWFLDLVQDRRGFDEATARRLGDGRVYSGDRALSAGLIDAIGARREARTYLINTHNLPSDIGVEAYQPRDPNASAFNVSALVKYMATLATMALGTDPTVASSVQQVLQDESRLGGLLSIWHPLL